MNTAAVLFGAAGAVSLAIGAVLTKGVVDRFPPRQLIGPLFLLNAVFVVPFLPTVEWSGDPVVWALHALSVLILLATATAVFDLYAHGAASAVTTAQATSPLPAAIAVALFVPGAFAWSQVVAAAVVVMGVLIGIAGVFGGLGRRQSVLAALVASVGGGVITVLSRVLLDAGAGLVEIYFVRTALAGGIYLGLAWPRDVPRTAAPALAVRALFITGSFVATILGVARGSPTVVQTMLALTPLIVLGWEVRASGVRPDPRILGSALIAAIGVLLLAFL